MPDIPQPSKVKYPYRFVNPTSEYPDNRDIFVLFTIRSQDQLLKIISSALEGAYLLYPDDHADITAPMMECVTMDCSQIAECLLQNEAFTTALSEFLLNNPFFLSGITGGVSQSLLVDSNTQLSTDDSVKDLSESSQFRDAVWGGCVETVEFWLDILKTLCFLLRAFNDVVDVVTQLYSKDKNKRYEFEATDLENNPHSVGADGEIVAGDGGEWEFVPNFLGKLVYAIGESTMLSWLSSIAGLGADLILADITDTRAEYIACVLFNEICCFDGQVKPPPYTFETTTVFNTGATLLSTPIDSGLAGLALSALLVVTGAVSEFISAIPLDETHRNFRIGMRSPSSEWVEICESCDEPPPQWVYEFDFTVSSQSAWWEAVTTVPNQTVLESCTWTSGEGWGGMRIQDASSRQREVSIIRLLTTNTGNFYRVDCEMRFVAGSGGIFTNSFQLKASDFTATYHSQSLANVAGIQAGSDPDFPSGTNGLVVQANGYNRLGANPSGATYIRKITIYGTGTNPFI